MKARTLWALLWRSANRLDGKREYLLNGPDCLPVLFRSRQKARDYAAQHYGYISERKDLRAEPFGWTMPKAVRVRLEQEARRDA